jgi:hypothetical protein
VKAASKNTSQSPRGKRQKPAKAERAAKLRQHVPFTADSLRDLLRDKVLIAPMVMPADGEIETLVNILNFWQSYYSQLIVDASAYNELLEREKAALDTLADVLPKLSAKIRADLHARRDMLGLQIANGFAKKRLDQIEVILKAIKPTGFWTEFWEKDTRPDMGWRELSTALATDFERAMRPANPTVNLARSGRGVVSRFIAAAIPDISGEDIEVATASRHFMRVGSAENV